MRVYLLLVHELCWSMNYASLPFVGSRTMQVYSLLVHELCESTFYWFTNYVGLPIVSPQTMLVYLLLIHELYWSTLCWLTDCVVYPVLVHTKLIKIFGQLYTFSCVIYLFFLTSFFYWD